ncbi:MAG: lipocalin family protein [Flammeovirgaceae bacterium]|nr:lipocalin family protein [Flammeovirgaceae bacterium]
MGRLQFRKVYWCRPHDGTLHGGFFKYQYKFNSDGTYRFVYVGASAYTDTNQLQYETGTYSITNNQLTITPANGANEEWSVVGGPIKLSGMGDVQIRNIKEHWGQRLTSEKEN